MFRFMLGNGALRDSPFFKGYNDFQSMPIISQEKQETPLLEQRISKATNPVIEKASSPEDSNEKSREVSLITKEKKNQRSQWQKDRGNREYLKNREYPLYLVDSQHEAKSRANHSALALTSHRRSKSDSDSACLDEEMKNIYDSRFQNDSDSGTEMDNKLFLTAEHLPYAENEDLQNSYLDTENELFHSARSGVDLSSSMLFFDDLAKPVLTEETTIQKTVNYFSSFLTSVVQSAAPYVPFSDYLISSETSKETFNIKDFQENAQALLDETNKIKMETSDGEGIDIAALQIALEQAKALLDSQSGANESLSSLKNDIERALEDLYALDQTYNEALVTSYFEDEWLTTQYTHTFGITPGEDVQPFFQNPKLQPFLEKFLEKLKKYKQTHEELIRKNYSTIDGEDSKKWGKLNEWCGTCMMQILEICDNDAEYCTPLTTYVQAIIEFAFPLNTQIITDFFSIGLFNPYEENSSGTLRLNDAEEERAVNGIKAKSPTAPEDLRLLHNNMPYEKRKGSPFLEEKSGWINVAPENICDGGQTFCSATKRLSFRLPDGSERFAEADLNLSPLGEISLEQNILIFKFLKTVGNRMDAAKLFNFAATIDKNPGTPLSEKIKNNLDQGRDKDLQNILNQLKNTGFNEEQIDSLIKIALPFNRTIMQETLLAIMSAVKTD